jgi:heterodisulfide reductase subunit A
VIDIKKLREYASTLEDVITAEESNSLCTEAGAKLINEKINEHNLNRVVVASCTPLTHEPVFKGVLEDAGLNPGLLEFVNIREHDAYVHRDEPEEALEKAKDLVRAAVARANFIEEIPIRIIPVEQKSLVIGGGIAGIQAALDLADEGFDVYLVEKNPSIGGKMAQLDRTFPTDDCSI